MLLLKEMSARGLSLSEAFSKLFLKKTVASEKEKIYDTFFFQKNLVKSNTVL